MTLTSPSSSSSLQISTVQIQCSRLPSLWSVPSRRLRKRRLQPIPLRRAHPLLHRWIWGVPLGTADYWSTWNPWWRNSFRRSCPQPGAMVTSREGWGSECQDGWDWSTGTRWGRGKWRYMRGWARWPTWSLPARGQGWTRRWGSNIFFI